MDRTEQSRVAADRCLNLEILIVDDDRDTLDLLTCVLEYVGARVTVADSVKQAIATLTQTTPDILISDLGMPEVDGYSLMRHIRTLPQAQGGAIPAIALTAYVGEENRQRAIAAGFDVFLTKPIDPVEVVTMIHHSRQKNFVVLPKV
jgi:hypothetical protein